MTLALAWSCGPFLSFVVVVTAETVWYPKKYEKLDPLGQLWAPIHRMTGYAASRSVRSKRFVMSPGSGQRLDDDATERHINSKGIPAREHRLVGAFADSEVSKKRWRLDMRCSTSPGAGSTQGPSDGACCERP